ncbi:TPA: hypothetical protein QCH64_003616 [Enterobacter asburiae]|uniref:hypothetical protein n=1 Tax=Enterobacter asburiae TaxID=61645 RepID=UPI002162321F|nr:hypothetical protein [Enterobacter asburiae]MCS0625542.1 hypothetical protein [Enterobacter asburiae]HDR2365290.1 hypothetical protein [Enterobacter asburiae]
MTILRNSMLLRYTAAMALFSIAINTACANSGQVGIAPVSTTTLKESILFAIDRDPSISQQAAQLGRVRISTLRNENETFSQLNSITYIGVFLRLVTYSHLP